MFHVGQKVVCLADLSRLTLPSEVAPTKGAVYTIRAIMTDNKGYLGLFLVEIKNPPVYCALGFCERALWAGHFRPVIEKKTDISIFTQLLTPSKIKEPV